MSAIAQYWKLWCISPGNTHTRYQMRSLPVAQAFCLDQIEQTEEASERDKSTSIDALQASLLSQFHLSYQQESRLSAEDIDLLEQSAQAGLCLRCYVSAPILKACQKIDSLFSGNKSFTYQDLLPFVLNDDGKKMVVVKENSKVQMAIDRGHCLVPAQFKLFSVEVLRSYRTQASGGMSLENWTFLRTKQQPELKSFLSEFGFQPFSDWTLINRIQINQKARLSAEESQLVDVFHQVYRRDRRASGKFTRCQTPSHAQLIEMSHLLEEANIAYSSPSEMLSRLKQIAQRLRDFDIWKAREPLEIPDCVTGDYQLRTDLPQIMSAVEDIEEQELTQFLYQKSSLILTEAIDQAVQSRLAKLQKSKRYGPFSDRYVSGLLRYYQAGISLREIGQQLGMNNWDQTRRILNPGELLNQVRLSTSRALLSSVLERSQDKGLVAKPPQPNQLKQLMDGVDSFLDETYFAAAATEIKAGKNRSLDSEYAQRLIQRLRIAKSG